MQISDDTLDEFIAIYRAEFDEEISRKDAGEMALRVLRLYDLLSKQLPPKNTMPPSDDHPPIGFRT